MAQLVKDPPTMQEMEVQSLVGKISCKMKWLPMPVFLPGKSHGQSSLEGYSPWGHQRVRNDLVTIPPQDLSG